MASVSGCVAYGALAVALLSGAVSVSPAYAQMGWAASIEEAPAGASARPASPSSALERAARSIPAPRPGARPASSPPLPKMKPRQVNAAVQEAPSGKAEPIDDKFEEMIVTGAIANGAAHVPPPLEESARLFAEDGHIEGDPIVTGTVDGASSDLANGYCVSISSAAADARVAVQRSKLTEMEQQIAQRIATLEQKTLELRNWVERRDAFLQRANASLVKIYAQMEPDSAAPQLGEMDEETAASLLLKLEPQNASAILNEMVPSKAARLASTIAGAARQQRASVPPRSAAPTATPGVAQPLDEMPAQAYPSGGRS